MRTKTKRIRQQSAGFLHWPFESDRLNGLVVVIDAGLEHTLVDTAYRANPIVRQIFKRRSGFDAVFGIAFFGIVCVATRITEIFLHSL